MYYEIGNNAAVKAFAAFNIKFFLVHSIKEIQIKMP